MLIHNVSERKEAANRKMLALLTFLKEETYSDFKTLKKVVGFKGKSHRPTYALLNKSVALGFLIKNEYPVIAGKNHYGETQILDAGAQTPEQPGQNCTGGERRARLA